MSEPTPTLALSDLEKWTFGGTALAVLGHPVSHSVSPAMHNAALAALAASDPRYASWRYFRIDVPPSGLRDALARLHALGFHGVNLTVPHKVLAMEMVGEIDPAARKVGAVNTLHRTADGWRGFNTDGAGLSAGIEESLGRTLAGSDVLLLGAGGAARGAAVECLERRCASLTIVNRTQENLTSLLQMLQPLEGTTPVIGIAGMAPAGLPAGTLVINATSAGLRESDPVPVDLRRLKQPSGVYDMIYNPAETPLLREARSRGIPAANGVSMLVHQGAKAFEIWTGTPAVASAPVMRAAADRALAG